jgi:general secretion pathway protein N
MLVVVIRLDVPRLAALVLGGDLRLQIGRLAPGRGWYLGDATLQWRDASSTLSRVLPLADYALRLDGTESMVRASLRTLRSPLELAGSEQ